MLLEVTLPDFSDDKVAASICKLRMKMDDFSLIKVIGRGAFGEVQLVRNDLDSLLFVSALEAGIFDLYLVLKAETD
jgi:hypothetical protein